MRLTTKITKLASTPPWAHVVNFAGISGFWVDTNIGSKMFIRQSDHVIWLPRTLRGRKVEDLSPEEVKAVPKEDSGKVWYKQWREQNDNDLAVEKLHNGYTFSDIGQVLIDRLQKLVDKYELDDVSNIGLDSKFSINPFLFEKLLKTNNRDDVKRIGRLIAKKFALIIHLLNQVNPKMAKRLDADFMLQYNKLQNLFDFDVTKFEPNLPEPEEAPEPTHLFDILNHAVGNLVSEVKPFLTNPQLGSVANAFGRCAEWFQDGANLDVNLAIRGCQADFKDALDRLTNIKKMAPPNNPLHEIALQILNLESLKNFYNIIYGFENS
jgi:hypothetical protein